ncbi:MAG: formimidoylglutamase [Flavobacterium sp.]|nr:formimidoylglutamase [Flavobacterium sp.]
MEYDFLSPVDASLVQFGRQLSGQHFGSKIIMHTDSDFPNLDQINIAIIGVTENRGTGSGWAQSDLSAIRKELYSLFPGNWDLSVADLGDIIPGESVGDTYFAVRGVVAALVKRKVLPIVIGGSQDLTYAIYRAYDSLEQMVNLVAIDSKFDLGKDDDTISAGSYLSKIVLEEPNNLFNFSNLGFQTYYNSQEEIDLIEKLFFDAYRLGEISSNISLAEPVLRDADIVSVDLTSIKSSDSANNVIFTPNGFDGKEICALARYAGISDRVSVLGVFNHNSTKSEAVLIAQIVWYFIEGYHYRSNEYPFSNKEQYLKYIVPLEDHQLIFYKSNRSDRWWIEIPFISPGNNKLKRNTLLPCSYEEYLSATNQELPERWWKAQRKNILL